MKSCLDPNSILLLPGLISGSVPLFLTLFPIFAPLSFLSSFLISMGSPYSHLMGFFAMKLFACFLAVPVFFSVCIALPCVSWGNVPALPGSCFSVSSLPGLLCWLFPCLLPLISFQISLSGFSSCFDYYPFYTPFLHISLPYLLLFVRLTDFLLSDLLLLPQKNCS
jgi:hypothetical protein